MGEKTEVGKLRSWEDEKIKRKWEVGRIKTEVEKLGS
jgi:hypothetical protein